MNANLRVTQEDFDGPRLLELSAKACEENLSRREFRELEELLKHSDDARGLFRDYTNLHVTLGSCYGVHQDIVTLSQEKSTGAGGGGRRIRRIVVAMTAVAAAGVAAFALIDGEGPIQLEDGALALETGGIPVLEPADGPEALPVESPVAMEKTQDTQDREKKPKPTAPAPYRPAPHQLAMVKGMTNLKWAEGAKPFEKGAWLEEDTTLSLRAGLIRLRFRDGATATVRGPAELEILGGNLARLKTGTLVAQVPPKAVGFTVRTEPINVVDLGTAFGVRADKNGEVEVHVYDGEVELLPLSGSPAEARQSKKKLVRGEAAKSRLIRKGTAAAGQKSSVETMPFSNKGFQTIKHFNSGVVKASSVVDFYQGALKKPLAKYEHNRKLWVMVEKGGTTLEKPVKVDFSKPGSVFRGSKTTAEVPAGTRVRSFLLHFNPIGSNADSHPCEAFITFDAPVAGIVAGNDGLAETDQLFSRSPKLYRNTSGRAIEVVQTANAKPGTGENSGPRGDAVVLSPDRRTVRVNWSATSAIDQVRVLVADEEF